MNLLRLFLLLGVLTGIVLPKSSAVLAQLGLIQGQVLVICTGDGLRMLLLDDDGTPVDITHTDHDCLLVHAADTATRIAPMPIRLVPRFLVQTPQGDSVPGRAPRANDAYPRAPPTG